MYLRDFNAQEKWTLFKTSFKLVSRNSCVNTHKNHKLDHINFFNIAMFVIIMKRFVVQNGLHQTSQ